MAKYRYHVKNYHAIKDADIKIDGITVLAGINGCGKSTLSRWLYYIVNAINDYDEIQKQNLIEIIVGEIEKIRRFFASTQYYTNYQSYIYELKELPNKYLSYIYGLGSMSFYGMEFESQIKKISDSLLDQVRKDLADYLNNVSESSGRVKRASDYFLNGNNLTGNIDRLIELYSNYYNTLFDSNFANYENCMLSKSHGELSDVIRQEYAETDAMPLEIEFEENGVELLENNSFSDPLMLKKAIYIDTPMVLSQNIKLDKNSVWGRFFNLLVNTNGKANEKSNILEINRIIKGTIGGNIKLQEEFFGLSNDIHYVRNDGLNIRIEDAATGIKSFAYIQRLLDNGWLTNETVLLIDEPEAHLHPQWIVDFARLLVLIHKNIGAKIVIASHNPDMVSAIHDMTEYYGILGDTNFYVAKEDEESGKYEYKNLNHEIGEIFESFNIALAKISDFTVEK